MRVLLSLLFIQAVFCQTLIPYMINPFNLNNFQNPLMAYTTTTESPPTFYNNYLQKGYKMDERGTLWREYNPNFHYYIFNKSTYP
ncbi:unnamed protein product [Auanema sp. JU1783]|nr:unnamed protein product [Auanema sp. JU1783]